MRASVDLPRRSTWISYLRVSTHEQANKELSLPAQRRQIGGYSEARGMTIEQEFQEPGRSAKSMNRPAFRKMLEYVLRPGSKVAGIVVAHSSRFTRNSTEARIVKSRLRKAGVRVVSVCQDLPDDPMGELMEGLFECIDQYESRINGARTSAAMAECARQGFYPSAHAPYGYRRDPVQLRPTVTRYRLVPEPAEAEIVREIFRLYVVYGGALKVACKLNERGIRYRTGGRWTKGLIFDVIGETAASGVHYYGRRRDGKVRPPAEWIPIKVEPIVDREVFELVQQLRSERDPARGSGRGVAKPHLLTGRLRCGRCGSSLQLETSGKKVEGGVYQYCYYNCRQTLRAGKDACVGRRIRTEVLDQAVLAHIADVVCTRERVAALRTIAEEGELRSGDLGRAWRKLITKDPDVGRAYVLHMIDAIVVDEAKVTITARVNSSGKTEAEVSKLLDGDDDERD